MAFGSKVLTEIEKREVLVLTWALKHWGYLTGMFPVVLRTVHTLIRYVLSEKINEGWVSNPRLAG